MLKCHCCKQYLSTDNFFRHAGKARGYQNDCKRCHTARVQTNRPASEPTRRPPSRAILYWDFKLNG